MYNATIYCVQHDYHKAFNDLYLTNGFCLQDTQLNEFSSCKRLELSLNRVNDAPQNAQTQEIKPSYQAPLLCEEICIKSGQLEMKCTIG